MRPCRRRWVDGVIALEGGLATVGSLMAESPNWKLLDDLRAVVRAQYHAPDEIIAACTTIIAETLTMIDDDPHHYIEQTKQLLDSAVSFKRDTGGA